MFCNHNFILLKIRIEFEYYIAANNELKFYFGSYLEDIMKYDCMYWIDKRNIIISCSQIFLVDVSFFFEQMKLHIDCNFRHVFEKMIAGIPIV